MTGTAEHRISWWAVLPGPSRPDGSHRIRRNRHMAAGDWGWDVTCTCGWDSRTGGAIHARIREAVEDHRWDADNGWLPRGVRPYAYPEGDPR